MSAFANPLTERIAAFLSTIGIEVEPRALNEETFVPGSTIECGRLLVDEAKLSHPGDLLHEAGHLAITPAHDRRAMSASAGDDPGNEMAAIAWSYAAAVHLGLPGDVVFHADGYKGESESLLRNFETGRSFGVPLLEWLDMTATGARADELGVPPYPHMIRWVRVMIESLRLALDFDPAALLRDLRRVPADRWIDHFNTGGYTGVWDGVALRGPAGATHPVQSLFATPGTTEWANTDLLDAGPSFAAALSRFECPLFSVRLLRLAPGAVIKEHTDHALGLEDGEVRLHVPIVTSPEVDFRLNGSRVTLAAGETWYLNVNLPHRVTNGGDAPRVHLVLDCAVNGWLRELFAASAARSSTPSSGNR